VTERVGGVAFASARSNMKLLLLLVAVLSAGACNAIYDIPDPSAVRTPATERCTAATRDAQPGDEDEDGAIDEGCSWHLSRPHWMAPTVGMAGEVHRLTPSWVSRDGRRLYLVHSGPDQPGRVVMASRTGRDAAFGPPVTVMTDEPDRHAVVAIALSHDEREAFVAARADDGGAAALYRMTRSAVDAPFGPLAHVDALSSAGDAGGLFLGADDLELVFAGGGRLWRARRSSPAAAFDAPEPLVGVATDPPAPLEHPSLSRDGRTLFYQRGTDGEARIFRAERADATSAVFETTTEVIDVDPSRLLDASSPVLSEETRELFFASSRPWSPIQTAPWRAQICRDGPCTDDEIPCTGMRSPDGLHCYTLSSNTGAAVPTTADCAGRGAYAASIHSREEQELVAALEPGYILWIGAFDDRLSVPECDASTPSWPCPWGWTSGEPWTYAFWGTWNLDDNPDGPAVPMPLGANEDADCAVHMPYLSPSPGWVDLQCNSPFSTFHAVCETVAYPLW